MHMAVQSEAAAAAASAAAEKRVASKAAPGRVMNGTVTHSSPLVADVKLESGKKLRKSTAKQSACKAYYFQLDDAQASKWFPAGQHMLLSRTPSNCCRCQFGIGWGSQPLCRQFACVPEA